MRTRTRWQASARYAIGPIAGLRARAGEDTLTVFVNDNLEAWEAGREQLTERALAGRHPELVAPITPGKEDPFLVKGRHSVFYQTALEHLLRARGVRRLVLSGQVTEQCILYSALDAYLRGFELVVPEDAVAHIDERLARRRSR
jgi:nicotinamidase-related amidase